MKRPNALVAAALFLLTFVIYALTASKTISFWDCGEFTATAYGLGIPHQPGTPLYVLVGHIFTLLPLGLPIAYKLNLMSAFFGALAVAFTYLTAVRLEEDWSEEQEDPSPRWLLRAGAAVGAGFLALSTTFWNNSIEAEVYALASFVLAATGYMMVRWYEQRKTNAAAAFYLLVIYMMGLSVGFHLGSVLVYPGLFVVALLCRDKELENIDLLIVSMAMGVFVLSTMFKNDVIITTLYMICGALAVWRLVIPNGSGFAAAGIALFFLGLSAHLFMLIRTTQEPFINQSVPDTFSRLMMVIRREQYPPRVPWHREAPLLWQFGHFLGTSIWGKDTSLAGQRVIGFFQQFTFLPRPGFLDSFVPVALGFYGLLNQFRGNKKLAWGFLTVFLINSLGLLIILNFTDHEVRDRDYFYFGAFQFWALFMALGAGAFLRMLWLSLREGRWGVRLAGAGAVVLVVLAFLPVLLPGHPKYFEHDRSHNSIARDYGWNMLVSLPKNAILFTNGDNDTFPLWYLQGVEKFRTDVRVVNLSLINVPWYIKQLRDVPPKCPIAWNDAQIDGVEPIEHKGVRTTLTPKILPDKSILWVRDMAVWHIIEQNRWRRPIYFAVTIPPEYISDYNPYFSMEGLVYRLTRTKSKDGRVKVDADAIMKNLTRVYDMSGIWIPRSEAETRGIEPRLGNDVPFVRDESFYKDQNTVHLTLNYPAALCRVGYSDLVTGHEDQGLGALELAFELAPQFPFLVDLLPTAYVQTHHVDKALALGEYYLRELPDPRQMAVDLGRDLVSLGFAEKALDWADELVAGSPDEPGYVRLRARVLWQLGRKQDAYDVLRDFVAKSGDQESRLDLEAMQQILSQKKAPAGPPGGSPPTSGGGSAGGDSTGGGR